MMKNFRKIFICSLLILSLSLSALFAQETEEENSSKTVNPISFNIRLPTTVYLNTMDKKESAPSPIMFSPGFGIRWPNESPISFEPSINFFFTYFLFYNGMALPAEIENRTATTLGILLDLPASFTVNIKSTKLLLNAGPSILMRFAWPANGSGASEEEIKNINSWFWSQARFLYFSGSVSWIVGLPSNSEFGPFITIYAPLGAIFAREGLNGMIISVGLKFSFNR